MYPVDSFQLYPYSFITVIETQLHLVYDIPSPHISSKLECPHRSSVSSVRTKCLLLRLGLVDETALNIKHPESLMLFPSRFPNQTRS